MSNVTLSLLISFLAGISTFIGGLVVFIKFKDKNKFLAFSLSFSLSVMLSISVFELIPESIMKLLNRMSFLLAFLSGLFMFVLGKILVNKITHKTHLLSGNSLYRVGVLSMIALMIHNFPEGIATFMASYNDISTGISLGIAIMLHNIPEGISIAVPVYYATGSKKRGLFLTLVSGLAEPLGAFVSYILLKNYINDVTISLVLILVAGIMMSLAIDEMIPEVNKYDNKAISIIGMILGLLLVLINLYLF
jgi:ZIP family zinc transporter